MSNEREGFAGTATGAVVFGVMVYTVLSLLVGGPSPQTPKIHGALNPAVTQETINATICVHGWTRTVRPPVSYTNALKYALAVRRDVSPRDYELDHLIPLELGGAPRSPQNLWLEPWSEARKSDPEENRLKREVCRGEISLVWAQHEILDFKERHG